MFQIGDKIVHPMHGAGIVENIISEKMAGVTMDYYVLRVPVRSLVVKIPTLSCEEIGVRPVVEHQVAEDVLAAISTLEVEVTTNWNRRYRENMIRLKSGDLLQVASVVKGLMQRDCDRGLSTGERKMLSSAKEILISELVLAQASTYEAVEAQLNISLA